MAIPVKCNVHPWMKSYIAVFKHPLLRRHWEGWLVSISRTFPQARTPSKPGRKNYGTVDQQVTIGPKESKTVNFTFKAAGSTGD